MSLIKRILRDLPLRKKAGERVGLIERLSHGEGITDAEIEAAVLALIDEVPDGPMMPDIPIATLGVRAEPFLLAALRDPRCKPGRTPERSWGPNPFERVCAQLARLGSPALLPILLPGLESDDIERRRCSAFYIAHLGSAAAIEPVRRALDDDEGRVHTYAVMGIDWSTGLDHATEEFREAMFEDLSPYALGDRSVTKPVPGSEADYARTLFQLDAKRAAHLLTKPHALRPDNPRVGRLLGELIRHDIKPPSDPLLSILDRHVGLTPYFTANVRVSALTLLAKAAPAKARPVLDAILRSSEPVLPCESAGHDAVDKEWRRVQEAARQIRVCTLDGLLSPGEVDPRDWPDPPGPPPEVMTIVLVHALLGEVFNGGLSQYFYNSAGDDWRDTLAALNEIGHAGAAKCLSDAAAVFPEGGPATDRTQRLEQLEDLDDGAYSALDTLSKRLINIEPAADALLADYIAVHPDAFRVR